MTGDRPGVFCWMAGLEPLGKPLEEGEKESTREETYESGMLRKTTTTAGFFWAGERNHRALTILVLPFICPQWRINNSINIFSNIVDIHHKHFLRGHFLRVRCRRRRLRRARRRLPRRGRLRKVPPRCHQELIPMSTPPLLLPIHPLPRRHRTRLRVVDRPPSRPELPSRPLFPLVCIPPRLWRVWRRSRRSLTRPRVRVPCNVSRHECRPGIGRVVRRHRWLCVRQRALFAMASHGTASVFALSSIPCHFIYIERRFAHCALVVGE